MVPTSLMMIGIGEEKKGELCFLTQNTKTVVHTHYVKERKTRKRRERP